MIQSRMPGLVVLAVVSNLTAAARSAKHRAASCASAWVSVLDVQEGLNPRLVASRSSACPGTFWRPSHLNFVVLHVIVSHLPPCDQHSPNGDKPDVNVTHACAGIRLFPHCPYLRTRRLGQ